MADEQSRPLRPQRLAEGPEAAPVSPEHVSATVALSQRGVGDK